MAWHRAAIREDHRPRDVARPAEQLAVDEVRDPSKEQTDRDRLADDIGEGKERYSTRTSEQYNSNCHANGAAMEGHPAMPHVKRLERMIDMVTRLVEENVSDTSPEDDP